MEHRYKVGEPNEVVSSMCVYVHASGSLFIVFKYNI